MSTSGSPAATASSTTYWIAGLSTTGSISLGVALVAGRNLVPSPATGITALVGRPCFMPLNLAVCLCHRGDRHRPAVPAKVLRSVQRSVGFLQELAGRCSVIGIHRAADRD